MTPIRYWSTLAATVVAWSVAGDCISAQNTATVEEAVSIWPATGAYAGSKKCATCHPGQAQSYRTSSMYRALEPIDNCEILKQSTPLEWSEGAYRYVVARRGANYFYRVTDGVNTQETRLLYAFGQGKAGQTYVFSADGHYYESRVSYYLKLNGLSLTMGAPDTPPWTLQQALGRVLATTEARECFGCHTTGARRGNELQLKSYEAGVQCEACHGPGQAHIDSIVDGRPKPGTIRTLKGMNAEETSNLCGSCHRTWATVVLMKIHGANNVRFQPYRLANSQCFLPGDRRVACTSCHDPHAGLERKSQAYDAKCTACHNEQNVSIVKRACPAGRQACTSCHMPRVELLGANHAFADHWIRVVRAGEKYPD